MMGKKMSSRKATKERSRKWIKIISLRLVTLRQHMLHGVQNGRRGYCPFETSGTVDIIIMVRSTWKYLTLQSSMALDYLPSTE